MVPNRGLAMTLAQGLGVSWSPSSTITYSRPLSANPPMPFESTREGTTSVSKAADLPPRVESGGVLVHGGGRAGELLRQRTPLVREYSAGHAGEEHALGLAILSPRSRYAPPAGASIGVQGPLSRSAASWACISSM